MVMLAKIRRMHFRDGLPLRKIAKRTGLSRNTIRRWLRSGQSEPVYPRRASPAPARSLPVPVGDVAACRQPSSPAGTTPPRCCSRSCRRSAIRAPTPR